MWGRVLLIGGVAGIVGTVVGVVGRERRRASWWSYWADVQAKRVRAILVAVQGFLGAISGLVLGSLVDAGGKPSPLALVGHGIAYGIGAELFLHIDVGYLVGPFGSPLSLVRLLNDSIATHMNDLVWARIRARVSLLSAEQLIQLAYSALLEIYPVHAGEPPSLAADAAVRNIASWAATLTGGPARTLAGFEAPSMAAARALLEAETARLINEHLFCPALPLVDSP